MLNITKKEKRKRMFENIYDLIRGVGHTGKQEAGSWGELAQRHEKEAKGELKKFISYKELEWDGDRNIISLGKHFRFKLIED